MNCPAFALFERCWTNSNDSHKEYKYAACLVVVHDFGKDIGPIATAKYERVSIAYVGSNINNGPNVPS